MFKGLMYVRRLGIEERPPIRKVAAIILNNQSRTADKEWSYSPGSGRDANNFSPMKLALLRKGFICLGPGPILWYNLNNGKGACDSLHGVLGGLYRAGSRTTWSGS